MEYLSMLNNNLAMSNIVYYEYFLCSTVDGKLIEVFSAICRTNNNCYTIMITQFEMCFVDVWSDTSSLLAQVLIY